MSNSLPKRCHAHYNLESKKNLTDMIFSTYVIISGSQAVKTGLATRSQETQKYIYTPEFTTLTAQAPSTNKSIKIKC